MSTDYKLVCPETMEGVWIGQGNGGMKVLYSGEADTMEFLRRFLVETQGKSLKLISEHDETWGDYKEYKKLNCRVCVFGNKFPNFCEREGKGIIEEEMNSNNSPTWCPIGESS